MKKSILALAGAVALAAPLMATAPAFAADPPGAPTITNAIPGWARGDVILDWDAPATNPAGILGYESFWLGAQGWVAVCSNFLPADSARLFELAADARDQPAALALYRRILPLVKMVGGHRYVAGSKYALGHMGLPVGQPRAPRLPLPAADADLMRNHLDALQLKDSIPPK